MNISNGVDIIKISRIKNSIENPRFLKRVFSESELEQFVTRGENPNFLAGCFAGKEAFAKALGTGVRGFSLKEVSVLRNSIGMPYYQLEGRAKDLVETQNLRLTVSISHEEDYAIAFATAYKD